MRAIYKIFVKCCNQLLLTTAGDWWLTNCSFQPDTLGEEGNQVSSGLSVGVAQQHVGNHQCEQRTVMAGPLHIAAS